MIWRWIAGQLGVGVAGDIYAVFFRWCRLYVGLS